MTAPASKTFCILPWVHVYANPDGNVLPCCVGDYRLPMGNIQNSTLEQTFNNDKFKTMRKNMLQGKSCKECLATSVITNVVHAAAHIHLVGQKKKVRKMCLPLQAELLMTIYTISFCHTLIL